MKAKELMIEIICGFIPWKPSNYSKRQQQKLFPLVLFISVPLVKMRDLMFFHHVMIAKIDKEPKATSTQQSPPSSSSNSHLPYVADFPAPSYGRKRKRKENSNLFLN